jgi:hypothetical protein
MRTLEKKNVKRITDSRQFIFNRYKDRFDGANITYEQFLEDVQTGEIPWDERYQKRGLMDIIDYTIEWTPKNYNFYEGLTDAINEDVEEERISERPV